MAGYKIITNNSKSTLTGDFLFKKKDKKDKEKSDSTEDRPGTASKEALA